MLKRLRIQFIISCVCYMSTCVHYVTQYINDVSVSIVD